jgi:hypothetical protein
VTDLQRSARNTWIPSPSGDELPAYNGYGNVDDPTSFVGKVSTALQRPTAWPGSFSTTLT